MSIAAGSVAIVGAGPGDPELLTRRAYDLIRCADVIFYDALVGDAVLDELPEAARAVNVGKRPGGGRTPQTEINRRLVRAARSGQRVVRLKGGDPFVFGRGGEEAEQLAAHDVPIELVPGVSSVLAGPAAAGIPLTHREHASSLTVVTGHEDPTKSESALDWEAIARTVEAGGTLVILMGVRRLGDNIAELTSNGLSESIPVAMVERASLPGEYTLTGTLGTVVPLAREAGIEPPAITVVGDVVAVGESIAECLGAAPASRLLGGARRTTEGEVHQ